MLQRVTIEFAVDVPNEGVAGDVETRISREHHARLCDVFQSVTGYAPLVAPDQHGLAVGIEPVAWDSEEQDWISLDDEGAGDHNHNHDDDDE